MHDQQENELVLRIILGLDLLEHCLRFLEQNETFLELFLRYEVNGWFAEFVNNNWHLI